MWKLKNTLYGLKQLSMVQYHSINSFFINKGLQEPNGSFIIRQTNDEYLLVAILYVDDLIILASNVIQLKWLKSKLEKEFEMSYLRKSYYCLVMEFEKNREVCTIIINQKIDTKQAIKLVNMEKYKPIRISCHANSKLSKNLD